MSTNLLKFYYFTITSIFLVIPTYAKNSSIIQINSALKFFSEYPDNSNSTHYNISYCNPTMPTEFGGKIVDLQTGGACFNIYPKENCTGWFIRTSMSPETVNDPKTFQWVGEDLMKEDLRIGSVGPCFDRCDPRNWQGDEKLVVEITFYEDYNFEGHPTYVNLTGGCVTLANNEVIKYLSIRTYGQCVVLYALEGCKDTRGYHVLQIEGKSRDYYVQKLLTQTIPYYTKSVRLCGKEEEEAQNEDPDAASSCMSLASAPILSGIILLSFIGMVLISLSALGGAQIFKFYHFHQGNTAMLNVSYKSERHSV
ncbi:uncharacterized protein LOC110861287 isoform X1 [Folsomia candida]|uniref:uncharacterized protein LOC110861287 isoform X1 n=1 Tax=Folsomia candida TaxID=158441 RepID=UPI001605231A|nr:uncharacterized protein LOC110861287 isoform X1 [Folsomia candida]